MGSGAAGYPAAVHTWGSVHGDCRRGSFHEEGGGAVNEACLLKSAGDGRSKVVRSKCLRRDQPQCLMCGAGPHF